MEMFSVDQDFAGGSCVCQSKYHLYCIYVKLNLYNQVTCILPGIIR